MCTSFTISNDTQNFLSRTMDFAFVLDGQPVFMPRGFEWETFNGEKHQNNYAFVGTGRKLQEYLFADGVNEKGLAIAELYYANEAEYVKETNPDKENLAPHEFVMWVLGENTSVEEVMDKLANIQLVDHPVDLLGITVPLHFILTDATGATVCIETNDQKLTMKHNPIGVMANSPNLEWHLQNLSNYIDVQPNNVAPQKMGEMVIKPIGQGSGSLALPGSYVSNHRFVRTAFLKKHMVTSEDITETVNEIFHVLDSVNIPKGIDLHDNGAMDYTQYKAAMDTRSLSYYLNLYENNEIYTVTLTPELLAKTEPVIFPVDRKVSMTTLTI